MKITLKDKESFYPRQIINHIVEKQRDGLSDYSQNLLFKISILNNDYNTAKALNEYYQIKLKTWTDTSNYLINHKTEKEWIEFNTFFEENDEYADRNLIAQYLMTNKTKSPSEIFNRLIQKNDIKNSFIHNIEHYDNF